MRHIYAGGANPYTTLLVIPPWYQAFIGIDPTYNCGQIEGTVLQ